MRHIWQQTSSAWEGSSNHGNSSNKLWTWIYLLFLCSINSTKQPHKALKLSRINYWKVDGTLNTPIWMKMKYVFHSQCCFYFGLPSLDFHTLPWTENRVQHDSVHTLCNLVDDGKLVLIYSVDLGLSHGISLDCIGCNPFKWIHLGYSCYFLFTTSITHLITVHFHLYNYFISFESYDFIPLKP